MSSVELQQTREIQRAPSPEPESKKSGMNESAHQASKPSTKPQKGIMGMFASKTSSKNQDNGKEVKSEQKEEAPVVRFDRSLDDSFMFFSNANTKCNPNKTQLQ